MEKIELKHLTKVEGHARLTVKWDGKKVRVCALEVFESPRYFEKLIKGRRYKEVPYLASRICGVCSVAHFIGSLLAVEKALKLEVTEQAKMLRELMVLGGILHSHVLHLHMLTLPDYLGYNSVLDMMEKYGDLVEKGLKLKEVGNDVVRIIGGRSIHPLTAVIGGFTRFPREEELDELLKTLEKGRELAFETLEFFKNLKKPEMHFETEFMALFKKNEYPFIEGEVKTLSGFSFRAKEYAKYLKEEEIEYSTSRHVKFKGKPFTVGPLARMNIHPHTLSKNAKMVLKDSKLKLPSFNIFDANLARCIEVIHCIDRMEEILSNLKIKKERITKPKSEEGEGVSATEAPRGVLYHHYKIKRGRVVYVNIITPTTQNTASIEDVLKQLLEKLLKSKKSKRYIVNEMEKLIRAYDPCFSCSAHFLQLKFI